MPRNSTAVDPARSRATLNFYGRATDRPRLDFRTIAAAATGRWPAILAACGIDAAFLRDRHGPCPGCGGRDRFRYDDRDGAGTWLCSAGGGAPLAGDGFALLRHVHGWTAGEALRAVADALGLRDGRELPPVQARKTQAAAPDHEAAAARAGRLWASASAEVGAHPYTARKGVRAHGLRLLGDVLVMPLRDAAGRLWSLQFIDAAGGKRFLRGGRTRACFHRIGRPDGTPAVLLIGEGFATCASAHEATGHPAAVAHSAGNLRAVAEALRSRYPAADLILLADDDDAGRTACERAARAVNGRVATVGGR